MPASATAPSRRSLLKLGLRPRRVNLDREDPGNPPQSRMANVLVKALGYPRLTLKQKLAAFDPARHGGEVMATGQVGKGVF